MHLVLWIMGALQGLVILFLGIGARVLWGVLEQLRQRQEKLETRINALEVMKVKVESLNASLDRLENLMLRHQEFHQKQEEKITEFWKAYSPVLDYFKKRIK